MISVPPKILVVDDEPDTLRLVRRILREEGYQVEEAIDGQQALTAFRIWRPDLILLDIILPQHDGLSVLRTIREQDAATGIIMLSALNNDQLTREAIIAGADDYVRKPFLLREIRARIQQTLEKTRLRRENEDLRRQLNAVRNRAEELLSEHMTSEVARNLLTSDDVLIGASDIDGPEVDELEEVIRPPDDSRSW